jgi:hypothetical protein
LAKLAVEQGFNLSSTHSMATVKDAIGYFQGS